MSDDLLSRFRSGSLTFRESPFGYTGNDPSQLFADLGAGINPSGFVARVDNESANVIIDDDGIVISGAAAVGSQLGISNVSVTADGLKVSDGSVDRVTIGKISATPDYGLKVVNAGATVIIDGTSNMFKIAATGTQSLSGPDATGGPACTTVNVDVATGFTYVPATLLFMQSAVSSFPLPDLNITAEAPGRISTHREGFAQVVNTNQTRCGFSWCNYSAIDSSGSSVTFRYYILQETAF